MRKATRVCLEEMVTRYATKLAAREQYIAWLENRNLVCGWEGHKRQSFLQEFDVRQEYPT